jgi:hypothetical protein
MRTIFCNTVLLIMLSADYLSADMKSVYNYGFIENTETLVFGDKVRVRNSPSVSDDNIIDSLYIGDKITVINKSNTSMSIDGYKEYWYRISYFNKNNKRSEGYIWGGFLSIGYVADKNRLFLIGIRKYNSEHGFTAECRFVVNSRITSSISFEPHYLPDSKNENTYEYSVSAEISGNRGLTGLDNVLKIFFNFEACGYPRGNIWIGYAGNKLYYISKDISVSEAGVFYVEEKFIFPDNVPGRRDRVMLINETYDFDENLNDYKLSEKKETEFIWRNYKLNTVK